MQGYQRGVLVLAATLSAAACAQGRSLEFEGLRPPPTGQPDASSLDARAVDRGATEGGGSAHDLTPGACNELTLSFEARTPTVFVLVDRSSSMFERRLWDPLKRGVLAAIEQLQSDVRFGFATYTGQRGGVCPDLTVEDIALGNFAAIERAYDAVVMPTYKGETPTSLALDQVVSLLEGQPAGPKYVLLVTDGEADFCDDPNVICSRDAVVAAAQQAHAKGIGTFVFSIGGQVDHQHLADVANAGSGQPVADRAQQVQHQCPRSTAKYAPSSGSASFFEPDVSDQSGLVATLAGVVAGVRGCVFDLRGKLELDLLQAAQGVVELDGVRIPHDATDGYGLNSTTELELHGKSCAQLRRPEPRRLRIDFPCEAVILL